MAGGIVRLSMGTKIIETTVIGLQMIMLLQALMFLCKGMNFWFLVQLE